MSRVRSRSSTQLDPEIDSKIVVVDRPNCSAKLATMPQKGRTLLFVSLLIAVFAGTGTRIHRSLHTKDRIGLEEARHHSHWEELWMSP